MRLVVLYTFLLSLLVMPLQVFADWQRFAALKEKIQDMTPIESGLELTLPLVADDGSAVPLKVAFKGSLAENEHITRLWILADRNPNPDVIDFEISEHIPRIELSTRIRLGESQTVYALAQSNQGNLWLAQQEVRVTVSGCLMSGDDTTAETVMSQPRVALPRNPVAGEAAELRTMINHPMETGFREDEQGNLIAQQLVESLQVTRADQPVITANFHTGTSANPFVAFFLDQFDELMFTWTDQQGQQLSEQR